MAKNPYRRADRFTRQAKSEGYAARSVYKLDEIQRRFRLFRQGDRVVDLGCFPGSWARFAQQKVGGRGKVVGVDLQEPDMRGTWIVRSIFEVEPDELREALGGPADVVLSDMAPRTTGNRLGDHVEQLELALVAFNLARDLLKPGGHFAVKIFDGPDANDFVSRIKPFFGRTKRVRPEAVRKGSREFFLVATQYSPE